MAIFITGVAGFIGSNLAEALVAGGAHVVGFDNLSLGRMSNLKKLVMHPRFTFEQVDMADYGAYRDAFLRAHTADPITEVWHMAANSDIPAGNADARTDLRDTFMTTFHTLEVMKELDLRIIMFASSSAIYGDRKGVALTEDMGPLLPISNYGAMKLASEAAISAASESFIKHAYIFRFPNVIGTPATHGVILDFVRKLKATPDNLIVLGDGTQKKSYLHVDELIDAMLLVRGNAQERINVFNIGAEDDGVTVRFIAEEISSTVSPSATITYGIGNKGWVGDVPQFMYSIEKLRALGWESRVGSVEAVRRAVHEIIEQEENG